ncbi:hypothetical protein NKJ40_24285 [Mesorhizobium sp. M0119]|uniref:hypothetical protein n=1 Tax=Mesorhizobium sp. M0119 TaxID=2956885 RepID=UPI003338C30E
MAVSGAVERLDAALVLQQTQRGLRHRTNSGEVVAAIKHLGSLGTADADCRPQHQARRKDVGVHAPAAG